MSGLIFRHAALSFKRVPYAPLFMHQYKNVRADVSPPVSAPLRQLIYSFTVSYLGAIWNVVNFEEAKARFRGGYLSRRTTVICAHIMIRHCLRGSVNNEYIIFLSITDALFKESIRHECPQPTNKLVQLHPFQPAKQSSIMEYPHKAHADSLPHSGRRTQ